VSCSRPCENETFSVNMQRLCACVRVRLCWCACTCVYGVCVVSVSRTGLVRMHRVTYMNEACHAYMNEVCIE